MIVCRLATQADLPALALLVLEANQPIEDIPDLAFLCEDTEDRQLLGTVGVNFGQPGMVVVGGYLVQPEVYADPEMRRAVAADLKAYVHGWLLEHGCQAYVCSVSKRNTRMQRWLERNGGKRYTKKNGSYWYIVTIERPAASEEAA